jgi:hypothetical protein
MDGVPILINTATFKLEHLKMGKKKDKIEVCSICQCEFDMDAEGGTRGEFGILPVAFCPTCLSCVFDMVEKLK